MEVGNGSISWGTGGNPYGGYAGCNGVTGWSYSNGGIAGSQTSGGAGGNRPNSNWSSGSGYMGCSGGGGGRRRLVWWPVGGSTGAVYNGNSTYGQPGSSGGFGTGGAGGQWNINGQYGATAASGGGGSGYVYTSSTYSNYPSGCKLNSNYYLTSAAYVNGNTSFTNYDGTSRTGQYGNGGVKITNQTVNPTSRT